MTLLAIPNVSEGRDEARVGHFVDAVRMPVRLLDVHSDPVHNRSVLTATGTKEELALAMAELAARCAEIDLSRQRGVHPRLGGLDVCPFVAHRGDVQDAVAAALLAADQIADRAGLPVYLYGYAATREETRELPSLRAHGLSGLIERAAVGLEPDRGPTSIDPRRGVVCVGARRELIAFNVWLAAGRDAAARIASIVRTAGGGPPGVRALGLSISDQTSQVSMNLIDPSTTGIEVAFEAVASAARQQDVRITATEIVGLVAEDFMPRPDAQATRLLMKPGRSVESALNE
jgi:glutamate formiminotransferase